MTDDTRFGEWIRQRRKALDLTQENLADRVGCSSETIRKIESGRRRPSRQLVDLLAEHLKVAADEREAFMNFARIEPEKHPLVSLPGIGTRPASAGPGLAAAPANGPISASPHAAPSRPATEQAAGSVFGAWLRRRRQDLGYTQQELAELAGCSTAAIAKMEAGDERPSKQAAELLAGHLKVPPSERTNFVQFARSEPGTTLPEALQDGALSPWIGIEPPTNLVAPLTPLVGREDIVRDVCSLLTQEAVRLVTLSGPPGIGKTRVGQKVARDLLPHFPDGVFFVALAPVSDPELVTFVIAQTLGVREAGGAPLRDRLLDHLRSRTILLFLDNFEQVISAAPLISDLLAAAPGLKVLVTSRQSLRLSAEHEFAVPPLAVPEPEDLRATEQLQNFESVRLFVERAKAVRPGFSLTPDTAVPVGEICYRLDGLPLAIELAAARIKLFSPQALLGHLERRLHLLTGGARDLPARQQTLRGAIDWSFNLLDASEQTLFRRISIFVDGCTVEAAQQVCGAGEGAPQDIFETMASLVDKSLLRPAEEALEEPRFTMLETIREYGLERLAQEGETGPLVSRYIAYYLTFAEKAEPHLRGPDQTTWLNILEAEHGNLRAALEYCEKQGDAEGLSRISGSLWRFWFSRGHLSEGRKYLQLALAQKSSLPRAAAAKVLYGAGRLALIQGDYKSARALYEESLSIFRATGGRLGEANALNDLGNIAGFEGDYASRRAFHEEALAIFRDLGDQPGIASALFQLANVSAATGDYTAALPLLKESLGMLRQLGDKRGIALSLYILGNFTQELGNLTEARSYYQEALPISRELGDRWSVANLLLSLGNVACQQRDFTQADSLLGDALIIFKELGARRGIADCLASRGSVAREERNYALARSLLLESLAIRTDLRDKPGIVECVEGLAQLAFAEQQPERAALLLGATAVAREEMASPLPPATRAQYDGLINAASTAIGEAAWLSAWQLGRARKLDEVVSEALSAGAAA